jgi:alpha-1,3-glucosyltransferase
LLQVLRRIFPVGRGLYEDYLANFWCTTSVAIKWKSLLSNAALMPACAGITVLAAIPSMVQQILQPSSRGLLLGMANSAFAFFMFSYQVCAGVNVVVRTSIESSIDRHGSNVCRVLWLEPATTAQG